MTGSGGVCNVYVCMCGCMYLCMYVCMGRGGNEAATEQVSKQPTR